jgi:hypothetical protein
MQDECQKHSLYMSLIEMLEVYMGEEVKYPISNLHKRHLFDKSDLDYGLVHLLCLFFHQNHWFIV